MKKIIFIFVLFSITITNSQNKVKLRVVYNTKLGPSENYSSQNEKTFALQMKKYIEDVEYKLEISGKTSIFQTIKKMPLGNQFSNPIQKTKDKTVFYVDSIVFIEEINAFDEYYLIIENSNQINWILTNEIKIIHGYKCYKASYTKSGTNPVNVVAWYAPKLPYQFGPNGYNGLPGLILKVIQNEKFIYLVSSINWDEDIFVIKPTTGIKITREDFNNKVKQALNKMQSYNKN